MSRRGSSGSSQPLPIVESLGEAWRLVLGQPGAWFRALLLPIAIELAVTYGFISLYGPSLARWAAATPQQVDPLIMLRFLGMQLCLLIAYVLFAVSWHRFALLGPAEEPRAVPAVQGRHVRFLLTTVGLSLLPALIVAVPLFLLTLLKIQSAIVLIGVGVLFFALFVRWQLVFPAIALDRRTSFAESWQRTRGNGIRLFWLFLLAVLPPAVLSGLVGNLFAEAQAVFMTSGQLSAGAALGYLVGSLFGYLLIALLVGCLSGAYRRLGG